MGLKALDNLTLEITLKRPFPPFLSILAGATAKILPAKYLSNHNFFNKPIGSGPFIYSSVDASKKEITLNAFKQYYASTPLIPVMILKESTEKEALLMASHGEVEDLANWPLSASNKIFVMGKKVSSPVASTWIIGINTTKPPFTNLEVRQKFKASIDTEGFRKKFYPDSIPAHGYIPNGLPGSEINYKLNVTLNNIPKYKISLVIPKELEAAVEMKKFLETNLHKNGWNVEVVLMEWEKLMVGYSKKEHQAFLVSMNMDYPDADFLLKNFESDNSDNFSGLKNIQLDNLLKSARTQQDKRKRNIIYNAALKIVENSAVTINLFHPRANYWISNCVSGFQSNILSDVYIDYAKISLKKNCKINDKNKMVLDEK